VANHVRRQIRERIVTLVTNLTTTGNRVYPHQVYALARCDELPCLLVYEPTEECVKENMCHPGTLERTLSVSIEAIATDAVSTLADTLDQICKEVEVVMATDPYLSNLAKACSLTRTEIQFDGGDSQKPAASARMTWTVVTHTTEGAPDVVV
jgi:hypothetical protein